MVLLSYYIVVVVSLFVVSVYEVIIMHSIAVFIFFCLMLLCCVFFCSRTPIRSKSSSFLFHHVVEFACAFVSPNGSTLGKGSLPNCTRR